MKIEAGKLYVPTLPIPCFDIGIDTKDLIDNGGIHYMGWEKNFTTLELNKPYILTRILISTRTVEGHSFSSYFFLVGVREWKRVMTERSFNRLFKELRIDEYHVN